jgi:hypothetical protein
MGKCLCKAHCTSDEGVASLEVETQTAELLFDLHGNDLWNGRVSFQVSLNGMAEAINNSEPTIAVREAPRHACLFFRQIPFREN